MLKGFFDETNRDANDVVFIMAGLVGSVENWDRFADLWFACLSEKPSIEYYKSSEANTLGGQFYKSGTRMMEAKRKSLARVIAASGLTGYFTRIPHKALSSKPDQLKKLMGTKIYDWALMAITCGVLEDSLKHGNSKETVDFVFDDCSELRSCIESYEYIREQFPAPLRAIAGEPIPGNDEKVFGLQAADLLAGGISAQLKGDAVEYFQIIKNAVHIKRILSKRPPQLELILQYAREVFGREELAHKMLVSCPSDS